jgi:hypothetical protein
VKNPANNDSGKVAGFMRHLGCKFNATPVQHRET